MKVPAVPAPRRFVAIETLECRQLFAAEPGFVQTDYVDGLTKPVALAFAPDGRLFVTEQQGDVRVVKHDALLPEPALSLPVNDEGERGVLGIAFGPAFETNHLIYLHYTAETPTLHNRVSRFQVAGDTIDPNSEQILIDLPDLGPNNHNGGALNFGPDGKLYIAVGDNANNAVSQQLDTPLGKILRINADGSIPDDNPFFERTTGLSRAIWALGLRNPFTFAFRSDGQMLINDVGASAFEEINIGTPGANFGWSIIEGKRTVETAPANYVDPLLAYGRGGGAFTGASIAGAAFIETQVGTEAALPAFLEGHYLFADFGAGFVRAIDPATADVTLLATNLGGPVGIAIGPDGAAYVLEYAGRIARLTAAPSDLTVAFAKEPTSVALSGAKAQVRLRIGNAGTSPVRGRVTIRLLASADGVADTADVLKSVTSRVKLEPGDETPLNVRFRWPAELNEATHLLAELTAVDDRIVEAETANNTAVSATPVRVSPAFVDLSPAFRETSFTFDADAQRHRLTLDLRNVANAAFRGRATVSLSATRSGSGTEVAIKAVSRRFSIASQSSRPVTLRFSLPNGLVRGAYDLHAMVTLGVSGTDVDLANDAVSVPVQVV